MRRVISKCLRVFSFPLALLVGTSVGQSTNATVSGQITDPTGRIVPATIIVLTNLNTNIAYQTQSNDAGFYRLADLPPGIYRANVTKDGFASIVKGDIDLHVQDVVSINFALTVGSTSQSITVEAGVPLVNTESAVVGTVVDRQFVENIPLNGRSFQSLITLTPGVVLIAGGRNDIGQFSVNGQRSSANNFTVDGVSANFGAGPGAFGFASASGNTPGLTALGTTQSLASIDALQEFKLQTSTYAAEYGRQPGGQISIVTRSGTNNFHGSAFDYLRNDVFDATDWFVRRAGLQKPAEKQNDFGGTLGGPIVLPGIYNGHDRTFFFFSYEGLRIRQPTFALTNVPTLTLRQQAPAGVKPILNGFPLPNGRDLGNGLAEFSSGYSDPANLDAASVRVDHMINSKLTLFGRYNRTPSETNARRAVDLATSTTSQLVAQTITLGAVASLTPHVSNDFRANYSGNGAYLTGAVDNFGGATLPPGGTLIPSQYETGSWQSAYVLNFSGITSESAPQIARFGLSVSSQKHFNLIDNVSIASGAHQLKFGVDYRRLMPHVSFNNYVVVGTFATQQQVLAGLAGTGSISASPPRRPILLNFSAYAQDGWKISRRLRLDFGLRWDVNPASSEADGKNPVPVDQITNFATMQLKPGAKEWETTYNNFAPRLGVAYQVSRAPGREFVVRGGFGVFYDTGSDLAAVSYNQRFPYSSNKVISNLVFPLSSTQVAPAPLPIDTGMAPPYTTLNIFDPHLKLPYTLQWNVAAEQSLGQNQAITISYVGAAGRRLLQSVESTLTAINPKFTAVRVTRNAATSDYDALQAQFRRRLSRGLQWLVSCTWAHALDKDSKSVTNRVAVRGNADFDIRQVLAAAATYDIPAPGTSSFSRTVFGHWSIDTKIHTQTALPVDLVARVDTNPADGSQVNIRPNVNPGVPFYVDDPSSPGGRKINGAAFTAPAVGQAGNFGRNQVRGLGGWQVDFATRREFPMGERFKLQFRAEGFNIFNHPNFGTIQMNLTAANFGQATNMLGRQLGGLNALYQIGGPRSFQFALKLLF